jgi:hypothetical protein
MRGDEGSPSLAGALTEISVEELLQVPVGRWAGEVHSASPSTPATRMFGRKDALAPLGVTIDELPMTPERVATLVEAAPGR